MAKKIDPLIMELKQYQKKSGISQELVAHAIGVNLGTVNRWFNGHSVRLNGATKKAVRSYLDAQRGQVGG